MDARTLAEKLAEKLLDVLYELRSGTGRGKAIQEVLAVLPLERMIERLEAYERLTVCYLSEHPSEGVLDTLRNTRALLAELRKIAKGGV